jgi:uroporphyrinogen decarboxylase
MNSRERVLATLRWREPDRVPFNLRPSDAMRGRLKAELGDPNADFATHFRHDVRLVYMAQPERPPDVPETEWTPAPAGDALASCAGEVSRWQRENLAVCSGYAMGVFEQAKAWLGDEATLTRPYDEPTKFRALLDRITVWKRAVYGAYVQAGVDIVWIGDDLGAQRNLIMSPQTYREFYRPCHERIVKHLRSIRPDLFIAFHCCGHVTPLIPDLIEIGINVLEAVQAEAMDIASLKREFGRDIAFWGAVGAQSVLARTTPRQVMEGVRRTLATMAPGGGYIASPCHTLTDEVPWESIVAFHEAMAQYGAYPSPGR